jgi:hypothetical protein
VHPHNYIIRTAKEKKNYVQFHPSNKINNKLEIFPFVLGFLEENLSIFSWQEEKKSKKTIR